MRREHWKLVAVVLLLAVMLSAAAYARKGRERAGRSTPAEVERKVTEAQVPEAALEMLKKLAAGSKITEFAEEMENGHTFYEGSWQSPSAGQMDVLVTPTGDLVEIEVKVAAKQVPAAVRKAARKAAGKGTMLAFEKKTMVLYEVKFQKDNSRHELLLAPDGHRVEEEVEKIKPDEDDDEHEDEDEDEDEDDDEKVSVDEVSRTVKITILKHAAGGEIEVIECEDEGGQAAYEVGVIIGGKEVELKINAKGKLVSKEIEDDDDECDDDEDDDDECDDDEDDDDECDVDEDDGDGCDEDEDDDDGCDEDEDDDDECDDDEDDDDECDVDEDDGDGCDDDEDDDNGCDDDEDDE